MTTDTTDTTDILATVDLPAVAESWGCDVDDPTFRSMLAYLRASEITSTTSTNDEGEEVTVKTRPAARHPFILGVPAVSLTVKDADGKTVKLPACKIAGGRSKGSQRDVRGYMVLAQDHTVARRGNWYAIADQSGAVLAMWPALVATVDKTPGKQAVEAPFGACDALTGGYAQIPLSLTAIKIQKAAEEAVAKATRAKEAQNDASVACASVAHNVKKSQALLQGAPFNMPAPIALVTAQYYCDAAKAAAAAAKAAA